jgi:hypothetical protein
MTRNTARVSRTGAPRGTTTVLTAERNTATTIDAPAAKTTI